MLRSEAAALIVRLTSGDATQDDLAAVKLWRSRSPEHERAFMAETRLWRQLGPALEAFEPRPHPSRRMILVGGGLAACAALGAAGLSELGWLRPLRGLWLDHATGRGERQAINLPDGSIAELDAESALSVDYSGQRRLKLLSGAAWIQARPAALPLVLSAQGHEISTSAAEFAVTLRNETMSVDCREGRLDLPSGDRLIAGEGLDLGPAGTGAKRQTDPQGIASWRRGLLVFSNTSMADVVADLNRHRRGKIVIARKALNQHRISGTFHLDRPEQILASLKASFGLRAVNLPGGIVVLR